MTVSVLWLFLTVPWVALQCLIVVFTDYTHFPFKKTEIMETSKESLFQATCMYDIFQHAVYKCDHSQCNRQDLTVEPPYYKFHFREGFIFAKLRICEVS